MAVRWAPVGVVPGAKQHINAIGVVGFSESSSNIRGTGLWKLSMYGSKNKDGTGEQFERYDQMLSPSQQSQPLIIGEGPKITANLTFVLFLGAQGELDISKIGCDDDFRYVCFDFMRGDNSEPVFMFKSTQRDSSKLTTCSDMCDLHEQKGMQDLCFM